MSEFELPKMMLGENEQKQFVRLDDGTYRLRVLKVKGHRDNNGVEYVMLICRVEASINEFEGWNDRYVGDITSLFIRIAHTFRLSQFFECIGLKERNQPYMIENWNDVVGKEFIYRITNGKSEFIK